jgi:CHAT domain-containing protein/tetratricopeptide (TPR) repeat protein
LIAAGMLCPEPCASGALAPLFLAGSTVRLESQSSSAKPSAAKPETTVANSEKGTVLLPGKAIERELSGGQTHAYQISLSAGQSASLTVEQRGIDVVVQLFDPVAKLLAEFDSESRKEGTETVVLVAESAGAYQVRVMAKYPKDTAAQYAIRLLEIRTAAQKDRSLFAAHELSTESQAQSDAGKYDDALDSAGKALAQGEEALRPDDAYIGELVLRLGGAQFIKGDFPSAVLSFQRALRIDETTLGKEDPQTALVLQSLGNLYSNSGDYPKGKEALQRALEINEKTLGNDSPRVAKCLVVSSILQQRRGDFPRALVELQRAFAIDQNNLAPDDPEVLKVMDSLGDLYFEMHDPDRAVPILEQTLKLEEQTLGPNHPWVAHPLQNLGIIARQRKQYALSLDYLWRAEKIREKALGSRHQATAGLLVNIGNVYESQGDYPQAIQIFQRALSILQDTAGPYHEWTLMTLGNLARVYAAQGDTIDAVEYMARTDEAAEQNLSLNLAIGSEHERLAYADKMAYLSSRTISLSVSDAPHDRAAAELAAQMILQRKGRVLDAVAGSLTGLRRRLQPNDQKLLDKLSTTTADLAKSALRGPGQTPAGEYQARLASLQREREALETEISRRSAGYYLPSDAVTLAAVRALIPSGSLLLEFAVFKPYDVRQTETKDYDNPRYVVYLIPAEGEVQWKDLGGTKEIDAAVEAFRQALRDPKRGDARQLARALDEKLMGPVRSLGVDARHLIISPDGELNLVPFEALVDEQGHYLLQNYAINYVSSGRDLLRMQAEQANASAPVIVADPSFGEPEANQIASTDRPKVTRGKAAAGRRSITSGKDLSDVYFAPLAGSAQEARALKSLFPEARVLSGQQATKAELEQVNAPAILHIATHGFFLEHDARSADPSSAKIGTNDAPGIRGGSDIENPLLRSGLALAGANLDKDGNEDGILTALEASNLNLWGTKLVTLSACDTGVGEVKNGEGVYGLRRAFVLAGAETLVMSLWPVSDYVTRELMTDYYSGLKKGLGRGEALRQAQLTMMKRKGRQHPFYWASFIQAGEWANLDGKR